MGASCQLALKSGKEKRKGFLWPKMKNQVLNVEMELTKHTDTEEFDLDFLGNVSNSQSDEG